MKTPCIIVNFKAYPRALGADALRLAKICALVAKKTRTSIAVSVQPTDVYRVASGVKIPVFSQHVDAVGIGAKTGWLAVESVRANGGTGSLVNHSEHQVKDVKSRVVALKTLKLTSVVCASGLSAVKKLVRLRPDFIAYEPPALIGGNISVSTALPSVIKNCAKAVGNKSVLLVGAGVKNKDDVAIALKLGAKGVLVASGVVKAKNPKNALLDLVKGLKE